MSGIERIAAERQRQVEKEGFDNQHDDRYGDTELPSAAVSYVMETMIRSPSSQPPLLWPFDAEWWKPKDSAIRNLEKAGALIAAEIDRLERIYDKKEY